MGKERINMTSLRNTTQLFFDEAQKIGLKPQWETDYGLFSVKMPKDLTKQVFSANNNSQAIYQVSRQYFFYSRLNLNGLRSYILSKNKHFTRLVLKQHNLSDVPYILPQNRAELDKFFAKHKPIICKPLLGQCSENVFLIKTQKKLNQCALKNNFFEKYLPGVEYRYLVLKNQVIAVQRKELRPIKNKPWNLFYIGIKPAEWNQRIAAQAVKIAQVLGLGLAGVDFIRDNKDNYSLLEVNSVPGIVKMHQPDAGISFNVARKILQAELGLD